MTLQQWDGELETMWGFLAAMFQVGGTGFQRVCRKKAIVDFQIWSRCHFGVTCVKGMKTETKRPCFV